MSKKLQFIILAVFFWLSFFLFSDNLSAQQSCEIINVVWGDGSSGVGTLGFGDTVKMTATGNGCAGWSISFQIWEDDLVKDDFVKSVSVNFGAGIISTAQAQWKIGEGDKPDETSGTYQFYIIAVAGESEKESSRLNIPVPTGGGPVPAPGTGGNPVPGPGNPQPGDDIDVSFNIPNPIQAESLVDLAKAIGRFLFQIAIPIAVIVIIYAGILYLTSGGNKEKVATAHKALWYAVIGLAIILIGQGFFTLIKSILNLGAPTP